MTAIPTSSLASDEPLRTPWSLARTRFLRNYLAILGAIIILLLLLACSATLPWSLREASNQQELKHVLEAPTASFPFGTDHLGQNLLARFLLGGAISLAIGLSSALIAVFIGTTIGLISGYVGGRLDAFLMRLVDVLYGLPYILLVILMRVALVPWVTGFLERVHPGSAGTWGGQTANVLVLLAGIGCVSWLTMARVVRGQVLSLREQPFVEAARALGFTNARILLQHILPNLVGPILVYATLTVPQAILSESFLSFLGLGIQAPLPSWGNLAAEGTDALNPIHIRWWLITWPCLGLSVALLALNFLGDGLRDALDPKSIR